MIPRVKVPVPAAAMVVFMASETTFSAPVPSVPVV